MSWVIRHVGFYATKRTQLNVKQKIEKNSGTLNIVFTREVDLKLSANNPYMLNDFSDCMLAVSMYLVI